jgi:hypothetical protein
VSVALLIGTDKGGVIARSDDRRRWRIGELDLRGWRVTCAARDRAGRTFVGVANESYGNAILASEDMQHWTQLDSTPRYEPGLDANEDHRQLTSSILSSGDSGRQVDQIWALHVDDDVLYAGVSEAGLFRSSDRGASWEPVSGINEHPSRSSWIPGFGGLCLHHVLSDHTVEPRRLWAAISAAGVFRSDDGGATWQRRCKGVPEGEGGAVCVHSMVHAAGSPDRIYAQFHEGMYRTLDAGDHWQRIEDGLPRGELSSATEASFGFATALDDHSGAVFCFPLAGDDLRYPPDGRVRVYRSTDGGDSWQPLTNGLPDEPRFGSVLRGAMSADGLDPCGIYVGTTSGQVYATADLGESWSELPITLPRILCVEAFAD